MVAMSPTITLKGHIKFSVKKIIAGGELSSSTFTGPGELILAPSSLGDITSIRLAGSETWSVGKDAYLAYTQGINKDYKRQGLGKAIFSGEGLFVYKVTGTGLLWVSSFGAIIRKDVSLKVQCPLCRFDNVDLWNNSLRKAKSISWITAIWWRGIQATSWNALPQEASFPACLPEKALCANLRALGQSLCRLETHKSLLLLLVVLLLRICRKPEDSRTFWRPSVYV